MDATFWQGKQDLTYDQILAKGRSDLVLRRQTAGGYDPVEDTEVPGENLEQPIVCIVLPVSKGTVEAFDNRLEGGTLIESNLRLLKIPAKGLEFEPRAGDIVPDLEGAQWTALGSTPVNPAGIPLLFNVTVKRG